MFTPRRSFSSARSIRRGFTLVEMLVVIGIALLLMGILLPAIQRAYQSGVRSRMAADLQAIVVALEAYKQDHGDIPRVMPAGATPTAAERGDAVLCRALIGPQAVGQDGQDGPGFRVRPAIGGVPQGKPYGPYLSLDKFRYDATNLWILDRSGVRILYFPANTTANINNNNGYIATVSYTSTGSRPLFNTNDADMSIFDYGGGNAANGLKKFQALMGGDWTTGKAVPSQIQPFKGEYMLWCAGPDGKFGVEEDPAGSGGTPANPNGLFQRSKCDDVSEPQR